MVPKLQPFVRTNPSSFASITKGQTVNLSIIISAPATSLPGTFDGTIQVGSGSDPKITFAQPLPVSLDVGVLISDEATGISFILPSAVPGNAAEARLESQEGQNIIFIAWPSKSDGSMIDQFTVSVKPNDGSSNMMEWFQRNIDPDGSLVASGIVTQRAFVNGNQAIILIGPTPDEYQDVHGSIPSIFVMSPSHATVASLMVSQINELTSYGYTDKRAFLINIVGTMSLP